MEIAGVHSVQKLAMSTESVCVVDANQVMSCWGENDSGQLGDGTKNNSLTPVLVKDLFK